ncbi:DUF1800 domain-containing protein [Aquirhabdus parva]|nr:DUF1800 domain-containing protein [Aquirhabdus parva]
MIKRRFAILALLLSMSQGNSAWANFDIDQKMDELSARAMLSRFGYGADESSLKVAMHQTPRQYLMHSIQGVSHLPVPIVTQIQSLPISGSTIAMWSQYGPGGTLSDKQQDPEARKLVQQTENQYMDATIQARLLTMANSDNQGHEALLSFWLNHFSIYGPKDYDKLLAWDYSNALEWAMRGDSFESLLRASFYHAAMQIYLDNFQSTAPTSITGTIVAARGKPTGINENLARELMELHTLGVDAGYSQKDVQELARIITGAGIYTPKMQDQALSKAGAIRKGIFLFDPRRHDFGSKTFLGNTFPAGHGLDEIDRALHILAMHPATAHHIAFKLARQFLSDNPPPALVNAMTNAYLQSNGRISATLIPLMTSPEFAASLSNPLKFKEPLDFILSAARTTCSGMPIGNPSILVFNAKDMGEAPFMHSTPDGYGATESDWLSPAAMAERTRFAVAIAMGKVPLVSKAENNLSPPTATSAMPSPMSMTQATATPNLAKGISCQPDLNTVTQLVGPISSNTKTAENGLSDPEKIVLLLTSPEFMKR